MVGRASVLMLVFASSLINACKGAPSAEDASSADPLKRFVFKHDGLLRDVAIMDPQLDASSERRPLVLVLHGGLGDDDDTVALSFGKLNRLAEEDDFVAAYPSGIAGHWNDGRNVDRYYSQRERVNDVDFLAALVRDLIEKKRIDPNAVFVIGVSDGAMMAHRFACERTSLLRAFTAVIGSIPLNVARRKSRCGKTPVSALMINGSEDPIVPWEGGEVRFDDVDLGTVIPVRRAFDFWANHNGCEGEQSTMIPDFSPNDGSRIERTKALGCVDDTKVELFAVQGAGHTWPSGWQYLPESMIGRTSHDIDAAVAAWRFFQSTLSPPDGF